MPRKLTPAQDLTFKDLSQREGVAHVRTAWDGKTLLLGVGMHPPTPNGVSPTRMYRIAPDGTATGV